MTGRSKKRADAIKTNVLGIRLTANERHLLDDKADAIGMDTSTWARRQLLGSARKRAPNGNSTQPPEQLESAEYKHPSKVRLAFADGLSGVWTFRALELDMSGMKASTLRATASGLAIEVMSKHNKRVEIDAASLRSMIDPAYAAARERELLAIRGPIDDLVVTAKSRL